MIDECYLEFVMYREKKIKLSFYLSRKKKYNNYVLALVIDFLFLFISFVVFFFQFQS